jgi:hypothetical protein
MGLRIRDTSGIQRNLPRSSSPPTNLLSAGINVKTFFAPFILGKEFLSSGLYYKHMTIVNYASSAVNKLKALQTDDARVVIYDRHVFIVQAPE